MSVECPVCGYDPSAPEGRVSEEVLRRQRLENIFNVHLARSWWITQPEYVCHWIAEQGVWPVSILDAGCGDGRWVPGITREFPGAKYTGIDRIPAHYDMNQERMPEHRWLLGDITTWDTQENFDLVVIGGTLNPAMGEKPQGEFLDSVKRLNPAHIVCLFDKNQTGEPPDAWIQDVYARKAELVVPRDLQSGHQDIVVWLYTKKAA